MIMVQTAPKETKEKVDSPLRKVFEDKLTAIGFKSRVSKKDPTEKLWIKDSISYLFVKTDCKKYKVYVASYQNEGYCMKKQPYGNEKNLSEIMADTNIS